MYANGTRSPWRCAVKARERNARRVRATAGGVDIFVGYAPTPATTAQVRGMVEEHRNSLETNSETSIIVEIHLP
jgi:hypothetical protein